MRSQLAHRLRSSSLKSLSAIAPPPSSPDYSRRLANLAARILYRSPFPSPKDLPVFILNGATFPDAKVVDYDTLLPYVLGRLPDEDELIEGQGYEIIFFAGGGDGGATASRKGRPGWGWFLQAYNLLTRATRKRLQRLYIVHGKNWVRMLVEMFSTIGSPKFRKKVVHVSSLSGLALHMPIENLLIPPSAYFSDRRRTSCIHAPHASGRRAFNTKQPFPISSTGSVRLPRVLREATSFILIDEVIKTKGLFRVNARAMTVEILKEAYNRGQKFILWRDGDTTLTFSHWKEGSGNASMGDVDQLEGYNAQSAAGLIKQWYTDLRFPIFPQSCYIAMDNIFGNVEVPIDTPHLVELLSVQAEWSHISKDSRFVLTMHLLPLLSRIAQFQEWNQMTPYNLAVCFAPTLLCGPDTVEDAKIAGIVIRVLETAIKLWKNDLAARVQMENWDFDESLRIPQAVEDREDPLEEADAGERSESDFQVNGITLLDNDDSGEEIEELKPSLPPRPRASTVHEGASNEAVTLRRKPAPALETPPRYSMVIAESPTGLDQSPIYNHTFIGRENRGFGSPQSSSESEAMSSLVSSRPRVSMSKTEARS